MSDFRLPKLNLITQIQTKKHINTNTTNFIKEFNDFNDKNLDPGVQKKSEDKPKQDPDLERIKIKAKKNLDEQKINNF